MTVTLIGHPTQQDTEGVIFGAGIPSYFSWWQGWHRKDWGYPNAFQWDAPDGWVWVVTVEDPMNDGTVITREIGHVDIMRAARKIIGRDFVAGSTLKRECRNLLFYVDECDIDACSADAILQVAILGDIFYG